VHEELPSPWAASRTAIVVYGLVGLAVWGGLVAAGYGVVEGLPVGVLAAAIPIGAQLQAAYRIRWAMATIRDEVGGATEASTTGNGVLALTFPERSIRVRGEIVHFRVADLAAEVDGERFGFPPRNAEEAARRIRRAAA
jgi:hypothetical protein